MAHEIEVRSGNACMFYAGEAPWHGLGVQVEKEVTSAAAIKLAGLDWRIEKRPLYIAGSAMVDGIPVLGTQAPNHHAVVRADDNAILGVVGGQYEPIGNAQCFDLMDEIVGSGRAVFHTAASIRGGRQVFMTVKLPGNAKVAKDKIDKFLLLTTSHDGSLMLNIRWTPIRVVCKNTMTAALRDDMATEINVKHTPNYRGRIAEARRVLELTEEYYRVMEEEFGKLVETPMTKDDLKVFVDDLFPATKRGEDGKEIVTPAIQDKRDAVFFLAENGTGIKPYVGSKWAAFNAVAEWIDHVGACRSKDGDTEVQARESRMSRILGPSYGDLRQYAFEQLQGQVN